MLRPPRDPRTPDRRVEQRHAALRQEETDGSGHFVEPLPDPSAHLPVFIRRRAHQCDLGIVLVEVSAAVLFRNRVRALKLTMSSAPQAPI